MKKAFYFGLWGSSGHVLVTETGRDIYPEQAGMPWTFGHMDTGLLTNGKHSDVIDGKVFWTCGGLTDLWFAFFWWDRSGDSRQNSNSGFYVKGFTFPHVKDAFEFACQAFPRIVARQHLPLVLQNPEPPIVSRPTQ